MSESTARADRFGLPASSAASYLWEVANKPVTVRLNLEMVERLEREVVDSFRSLSSRGSEIGGFLLGSVQSGSPARVSVEAYELVSCDYTRGPLYQFSETDAERFEQAAEQRNSGGNLRVVGFFRSHTRKGLGLDAEDTAFFTGHFRDPHQIALLIRPYASKPSTAGIFIWENGAIRGEASYQEFPFRRSEMERSPKTESRISQEKTAASAEPVLSAPEPTQSKPATRAQIVPIASRREITMPTPPERSAARPESTPEPAASRSMFEKPAPPEPTPAAAEPQLPVFARSAEPAPPKAAPAAPRTEHENYGLADIVLPPLERPHRSKMVWITAGCAAGLLLLSGALIVPGLRHKGKSAPGLPIPAAVAMSLRVERSGNELQLTWNRESDAIKAATRAVLAISDGDQHENVNLDLAQLRAGSVEYLPTTSDVSFQLSVMGQDPSQTHSESVRVLKTRNSTAADNQAPMQVNVTAEAPRGNAAATNTAAAPAPAAPVLVAENRSKTASPQLREFHPESLAQRLRPARSADLPEAPGLTAAAPVAVTLPGLGTSVPQIAAPPSASTRSAAAPSVPKAGGQIQQAQLISSQPPEYPLVAKQAHLTGVVVVSAIVGVDGKVKSATAVSGPGLLQKAAVSAVRQWIYKPTTLNGAPVESETRVEIKFTNGR